MKIISAIDDDRINARSSVIEIPTGIYISLARSIIKNNPFQRKRVRSSQSVYSLLKQDLKAGCVIPPIVLAFTDTINKLSATNLKESIEKRKEKFLILDGLQRSHTLIDAEDELGAESSPAKLKAFRERPIRCEIYEGANRAGILYRMLTLNAGQTAMSLRHQIEIMYLDYLDQELHGIDLTREVQKSGTRKWNQLNFKDAVEGFNAYVERSELPLDRSDILDNIAGLENLSKESKNADAFGEFIGTWSRFIEKIAILDIAPQETDQNNEDYENEDQEADTPSRLWAKNGVRAFKRPQAISGFGAALGLLKDDEIIKELDELDFDELEIGATADDFIDKMNYCISRINKDAKKIGNAQRLYFRQYFRMLLLDDSGCKMNLTKAADSALKSSLRLGI